MSPNIDINGVWRMSKPFKVYLSQDEDEVKLSIS